MLRLKANTGNDSGIAMLEVQQRQSLSAAATRLLDYIERHPNAVLVSSALELAAKIDASDATVIRSIQSLGFDGLPHLKTVIAEKLDQGSRTPVEKVGVTVRELTQETTRPPLQLVVEAYAKTLERLSILYCQTSSSPPRACLMAQAGSGFSEVAPLFDWRSKRRPISGV